MSRAHAQPHLLRLEDRNGERVMHALPRLEDTLRAIGLDGERAFVELTKLLLAKLGDDRREGSLLPEARAHPSPPTVLDEAFRHAKTEFQGIFEEADEIVVRDKSTILELLGALDELDLERPGLDLFGVCYEHFFSDLFRGSTGKFFTPRTVVKAMVEIADPQPEEVICDPCCGSGGFLIGTSQHLQQSSKKDAGTVLVGNDIDPHLVRLCRINAAIHGLDWNTVFQGNFFDFEHTLLREFWGHVDLVLANPPFSVEITDADVLGRFAWGQGRTSQLSDYLFLEQCHNLLAPHGRMLVVLPYSVTVNRSHADLREWLNENWYEVAAISLPEGIFRPFGGSGAKTCVLYLIKRGTALATGPKWVLKANVGAVGYNHRSRRYRLGPANDLPALTGSDEAAKLRRSVRRWYREGRKVRP